MFLDAAVAKLMEKHEIQVICMRQKPTLEKAKELRKMHFAPEMIKQKCEEIAENKDK